MHYMISKGENLIIENMYIAKSFWKRLMGLMFKKSLINSALLIPNCSSIHTCFMNFDIDLVYLDQTNKIVKTVHNLKPWKFSFGNFSSKNVLELPAGTIEKNSLKIGDQLQVMHK